MQITPERPLRVAIVGSGPAGFYAAEALLKRNLPIEITMIDRLPAPFGLVRYGVAPDHAKIKSVIKVFEKTLSRPNVKFLGNVSAGKDISVKDLKRFFDAVILSYGAEDDRKLGIPGEDLSGSHTATEFVAWYNGHPDYQNRSFDVSCKRAVVIGQGNVAMDVCRILCKTVDELKNTDISAHALEVLAKSQIEEIHMIGRRGPAQAAFTTGEIREFGHLIHAYPIVKAEDLQLNGASQKEMEDPLYPARKHNYEILQSFVNIDPAGRPRKFVIHFFKSPKAIEGSGRVEKIILEKNVLEGEVGNQKAKGTGQTEALDCGLILRSVGYKGLPLPEIPFDEKHAVILNSRGRIIGEDICGCYAAGWIKRGASGVIGTNKPDSEETVQSLMEDLLKLQPSSESNAAFENFLKEKNVRFVTFADWQKIDAEEIRRGQVVGKPREKFVNVEDMLKAAGK